MPSSRKKKKSAKSTRKIRVLITGGPTRAYLDRVRFLSNISSGALAYELCRVLCRRGFEVALISGPCDPPFDRLPLKIWKAVETNDEMHATVMQTCRSFRPDFAVFAAAVLDFAPAKIRVGKVSSGEPSWQLTLKPTRKIIDDVGRRFPRVRRFGFKLEWKKPQGLAAVRRLAARTIREKKLEALCLNFLPEISGSKHLAFLLSRDGTEGRAQSKSEIAAWITDYIRRISRAVVRGTDSGFSVRRRVGRRRLRSG